MNLITKNDFCLLIGIQAKHLPVYYDRKKFVYDLSTSKQMIDTENPINAVFIKQLCLKKKGKKPAKEKPVKEKPIPKPKPKPVPEIKPIPKEEIDKIITKRTPLPEIKKKYVVAPLPVPAKIDKEKTKEISDQNKKVEKNFDIEIQLKQQKLIKEKEELRKLKLQTDKLAGNAVPVALVTPLILQQKQSFVTCMKSNLEALLTEFGKIKEFSVAEISFMRGKIIDVVNKTSSESTQLAISSIDSIIEEFILKKGVGERN